MKKEYFMIFFICNAFIDDSHSMHRVNFIAKSLILLYNLKNGKNFKLSVCRFKVFSKKII